MPVPLHTPSFSSGHLEVISGPMFSGKTEELIRRVRRAKIAKIKTQVFKHKIDTRYHSSNVVSHSAQDLEAIPVSKAGEILNFFQKSGEIIAIDEVNFFDNEIIDVVLFLIKNKTRVICAGLDLDFRGVPFGPMPSLLALADQVTKVSAICTICGNMATKTQRINIGEKKKILVGHSDYYEARCTDHHTVEETKSEMRLSFQHNFASKGPSPIPN